MIKSFFLTQSKQKTRMFMCFFIIFASKYLININLLQKLIIFIYEPKKNCKQHVDIIKAKKLKNIKVRNENNIYQTKTYISA